jgi:hypothetical protein
MVLILYSTQLHRQVVVKAEQELTIKLALLVAQAVVVQSVQGTQ